MILLGTLINNWHSHSISEYWLIQNGINYMRKRILSDWKTGNNKLKAAFHIFQDTIQVDRYSQAYPIDSRKISNRGGC